MTSKEWVIPPRPKPGRKPATDTPPTKRKAQNRAAQRAFRERRAARVGELEEELNEQKEEHEKRERELEERIRHLEVESETLRARCQWLESTLEKERLDRVRQSIHASPMHQHGNAYGGLLPGQIQTQGPGQHLVGPRPIAQPFSISHIISPPDQIGDSGNLTCGSCSPNGPCSCANDVLADTSIGCGKCTLGSRCECLEALQADTLGISDLKRPLPPGSPSSSFVQPDEKRHRSDAGPPSALETDFTAMFSHQQRRTTQDTTYNTTTTQSQPRDRPLVSVEMKDSCGFCKDGTYCICADTTPVTTSLSSSNGATTATAPTAAPPLHQQQTQTPPPSEDDVVVSLPTPMEVTATGAIKLPPFSRRQEQTARKPTTTTTASPTCGPRGPGTCAQCLSDPKSGLFCRSLAANFERVRGTSASGGGGCCGGASASGGCCKQQQQPEKQEELGLSLSCADAYKTLASHRHFDEAAGEIGEWLPRLRVAPVDVAGRRPIEVEAASIMSVLRGFDVRFGS